MDLQHVSTLDEYVGRQLKANKNLKQLKEIRNYEIN